jgi:putative SOS response-associated peptidase YedK
MCGKFKAKKSWQGVTDALDAERIAREGDDPLTYRVMDNLPVIVWDIVERKRRVVPMRWGFPAPGDWKKPQPIHARAETIDTTHAFADAFAGSQCVIVLMRNFNEAPDIESPTRQHVITPDDAMLAAAVLWRRFDVGAAEPLFACVLVTVAANDLIATLPTDRMPAFLVQEDWELWLGEAPGTVDERKACLRSQNGARWTMAPEERSQKAKRTKPIVSSPGGLF